jgi:hypothetical protein
MNVSPELVVEVLICLQGLPLFEKGIDDDGGGEEVVSPWLLLHSMVSRRQFFVSIVSPRLFFVSMVSLGLLFW